MQRSWLQMADAIRQRNTFCSDSGKMATDSIRNKSLVERTRVLFSLIFHRHGLCYFAVANSPKGFSRCMKSVCRNVLEFPRRIRLKCDDISSHFPFSNYKIFRRMETGDREQRSIHLTQIEWNQFCSAKSFCSVVRDTYRNTPIFFQLFVFNYLHVKQYQTILTHFWLTSCCSTFAYWVE